MRQAVCVAAVAAIFSVVTCNALMDQKPNVAAPFWETLKPGTYAVGFRVLVQYSISLEL